ncbi:Pre-mRNA-splicing factor [Wickerhamomyces ciferrii]|uniref:Pre-mRNA-splicing factor SYF1 n=1 Tax=Wickerhamomyces ciferrii (strain ATCC 14091 / BCRC 22168 / CBS 111 / JCM 3599 / NBRC 0793 / NRRL Y-1031 F-60-10) TaxID=1206466 RepID=K0KSZ1_WICCF|nr:Pre-mRNA-splicing factor [Wickerhamomyces ciferrii]CCH46256.1 Pre-mRNA-splicing factor [Wickerhamomyces ciferrii]
MSEPKLVREKMGLELIEENDLPYEYQILEGPNNLTNWLRYYWHKDSIVGKLFVLQRACDHLKRSYKLWIMYLEHRVELVEGLNPVHYKEEYLKVNKEFEKSLYLLNKMPLLWLKYLQFLNLQTDVTLIRRKYTEALRTLPLTQHHIIWPSYLEFADKVGGLTGCKVYLKYLIFNPDEIELVLNRLIQWKDIPNSLIVFQKILDDPSFVSKEGKSPLELWLEYLDLLISFKKPNKSHDITVETFTRNGMKLFTDQQGKIYVKLATYFIKRRLYEKSRSILEEGLITVKTIKDFTVIYDSYAEFEESYINKLVEQIQHKEESNEDASHLNNELDLKLARFEKLMDRRPFLISDIKLRQDSNNVDEWLHRITLFNPENLGDILNTYVKAITTIEPYESSEGLSKIWIQYSKIYEDNGDLNTARTILDKAVKVPFKEPEELVNIWLEWSELELRQDDIEKALKVLEVATKSPLKSKIDYKDVHLPVQARIHKSIKLWSFYLDLVESSGDIQETCRIYDRVFELKIATPMIVVNYANFLEENQRFEESFKIYERGIGIFSYPTVFEIWNIYLTKALKRNLNVERIRDLFEHALDECPDNLSKSIYILYANFEIENGLTQKGFKILQKAINRVSKESIPDLYQVLISQTQKFNGLIATRPIFESAIEKVPETHTIDLVLQFATVETELKEFNRVRELLKYGGLLKSPLKNVKLWEFWNDFEIQNGNKDTFKDMLRVKREAMDQFNTDILNSSESIGFVKSSTGPKVSSINASEPVQEEQNPDAIDLDI